MKCSLYDVRKSKTIKCFQFVAIITIYYLQLNEAKYITLIDVSQTHYTVIVFKVLFTQQSTLMVCELRHKPKQYFGNITDKERRRGCRGWIVYDEYDGWLNNQYCIVLVPLISQNVEMELSTVRIYNINLVIC